MTQSFNSSNLTGSFDLRDMEVLARELRQHKLHVTDLPHQFTTPGMQDPENIRLWRDATRRLLGWMVMQINFESLDFAVRPEAATELLPQMLAWADERSRAHPEMIPLGTPEGKPCWFANIFADETECRRILERVGFADQGDVGEYSWSKVFMMRPADLPVKDYRIPPGFVVRPFKGDDEVDAYVEAHREVFCSKNMTPEWRRRIIHHPNHIPDLDLAVVAPDGRAVAFCVCWLDTQDRIGQIEPLGCRGEYRHYALGRVALAEGLRRLKAHGATKIFVETDNWRSTAKSLYESLGFELARDVRVYRKDY